MNVLLLCVSVPFPGFTQLRPDWEVDESIKLNVFQSRFQDSLSCDWARVSLLPCSCLFQSRFQDSLSCDLFNSKYSAVNVGVSVPFPGFTQLRPTDAELGKSEAD